MDIDEYDEQDLFIVDFSQNIYDNTDEPDDDSDNFEEIQNEKNIRDRGGNRGRGRGQGQGQGQGWSRAGNSSSERDKLHNCTIFMDFNEIIIFIRYYIISKSYF